MSNATNREQFVSAIVGEEFSGPVDATPAGFASHLVLLRMVRHSNLGYTGVERASGGDVKYNRARDVCMGQKAPAKVSEVIAMARACGQRPIEIFYRIAGLEESSRRVWTLPEPSEDLMNEWARDVDEYAIFDEEERRDFGLPSIGESIIRSTSGDDVVVGTFGRDGRTYSFTARIRSEE